MSIATTRNVVQISDCAEQLIRNKLLIDQSMKAYPEETAKKGAWHLRFCHMRRNRPGSESRLSGLRQSQQRDWS